MAKWEKFRQKLMSGQADANIEFKELCAYLERRLGFTLEITGSHHRFDRLGVDEIINLQPDQAGKAKPYQVKQVRDIIERYGL